jgi:hypothetical protein
VDAARAVAVIGMVMVHFSPPSIPETPGGALYDLSHGRASVLFALLAGIGVALLARGGANAGRARLLLRAAPLLPLGLWLQGLDHNVLVILQYYALYFLLAVFVLTLPDRWLLGVAAAMLVLGPLAYIGGQLRFPEWYAQSPAALGDPAGRIVHDLLLSGSYPLVTWCVPLLVGVWIGRRDLRSPPVRRWLVGGGLAVAGGAALAASLLETAFGPGIVGSRRYPDNPGLANLLAAEPHSQMPLWMLGAGGSAACVLGAMLVVSDLLPRTSWPLVATGQLALTVYVGHVLLLAAAPDPFETGTVAEATATVGVFMLVTMALCVLWRTVFRRGPLEAALAAPWSLLRRARRKKGEPW